MRHRWTYKLVTDETTGIPRRIKCCDRCETTKEIIWTKALPGFCIELVNYVRPDGIQFTGMTPACEGEK